MDQDEIVRRVRHAAELEGLPDPASEAVVAMAEQQIGFPIPVLLRRLYLEAANGGFGPEGGVLGVPGGEWNGDWSDIVHIHKAIQDDPDEEFPPHYIWLYEWGCGIWSLADCRDPSGPMWGWDGNEDGMKALFSLNMKFEEWISRALNGSLEIPERHE
ncbi:SMI1/KNR4 family protein [Streptomyces sp. NPDC096205]|uniref:SMI1/KNR4 family protein n=1 Tax=Streptomyces sp. NPDC096205 TaxID=3366081 RepID=UPI003816CA04